MLKRRWVIVALALSIAGCEGEQIESVVQRIAAQLSEMTLGELGSLAQRAAEDPSVADSILAANGVDVEQLDAIVSRLGSEAEVVGAALSEMSVKDLGDLASRITEDRAVADSLLTAHGIEAGQLDEVLDRIGPDAEALAAYLSSLGSEEGR